MPLPEETVKWAGEDRPGERGGVLHAVGDGDAAQEVAAEVEAGQVALDLLGEGEETAVADLVLGNGPRPAADDGDDWGPADSQGAGEVALDQREELGVR